MRAIPETFFDLVVSFEGLRLKPYKSIEGGEDTIYVGHKMKPGEVYLYTSQDAVKYLNEDAAEAFAFVDEQTHGKANDNEFVAMGDFTFNEGVGTFRNSSLLALFNAGNKFAAANVFEQYNKAHVNGVLKVLDALTRRRLAEKNLFLEAV